MKNNKQINLIIGGLIVLVIAFVVLVATGVIKFSNNDTSGNTNESNSNVEVAEKDEVLKLIGLTDKGYTRMSDELKKQYNLSGDNYIDFNFYDIAKVFMDLSAGEYKVKDIDKTLLNRLLFNYANLNGIELENIDSNGDVNHPCYEGVGSCFGINEENYKKIAKLYDLSEKPSDVLKKFGDTYIIDTFATVDNPHEIKDDINISYNKKDIVVVYNVSVKKTEDYNQSGSDFNKTITFTFSKKSDYYYLANIKVEEK